MIFVTHCGIVHVFPSQSEIAPVALVVGSSQLVDVVVVPRGHDHQIQGDVIVQAVAQILDTSRHCEKSRIKIV